MPQDYNPFAQNGSQPQPETPSTPPADYNPFAQSKSTGEAAPVTPAPESKMPFMATAVDKYGLPYYGEGVQGYARKVFATVFDPAKIVEKPTQQQAQMIGNVSTQEATQLNKAGWDEWIGKWTGISSQEAGKVGASLAVATRGVDEQGNVNQSNQLGNEISTAAGLVQRWTGEVIGAGLESLSALDKASRKVQSISTALNEIGNSSTIVPDNVDVDSELRKMLGDNPVVHFIAQAVDITRNTNPGYILVNAIRAATAGGDLYQKVKTVDQSLQSSDMLYTAYWDAAKKNEYYQRVKAGENPELVVRDLQDTMTELSGSILGDPSTYAGAGIIGNFGRAKTPVRIFGKTLLTLPWETVVKIPELGEIVGLAAGKARLSSEANAAFHALAPDLEKAFNALGNVSNDNNAVSVLREAFTAARKDVREFSGFFDKGTTDARKAQVLSGKYGILAHDSASQVELTKKTVGTFLQAISSRFRNPDDMLETFKAYRNLMSPDDAVAERAFAHLKEVHGTLPFTEVGKQSMEFMTRLIDDIDFEKVMADAGNDKGKLTEILTGKVNAVISDMYPSVNDLAKAAEEAKTLGSKAKGRTQFLAQAYADLEKNHPQAIWANNVNQAVSKVLSPLNGFFANTLMGMQPAFAVRNLTQNSIVIWHDLGARAGIEAFATGAETLAKSVAGKVSRNDFVTPIIERETAKIKDILGFLPTESAKGIGLSGEKAGFGFIGVGQDVEKVHSAIISRYVVESEMEKLLRNGAIPGMDALTDVPKEMREALLAHAMGAYGNVSKTLENFRADQATGFYETWRHMELNPQFKDTMRRMNLLDELDGIRKTAADPVMFNEQMDAFINKIDNLAKQTANEPALVSADNLQSDTMVTIEKAFEEGGRKVMTEEELNDMRALSEVRDQLRNAYQDYADVMKDRIGRLLPPEQMRPFEEQFSKIRQVLSDGNNRWRNFSNDIYQGVYAQSLRGANPADLWRQVRTVALDMENGSPVLKTISMAQDFPSVNPADLTNQEFNGMMWRWVKDNQSKFWHSYTQEFIVQQEKILDTMAQAAGTTVDQIKLAEYGKMENPRLSRITELTQQLADWEKHAQTSTVANAGKGLEGKTLADMTNITAEFPKWTGGKSHLFNAVNADRAAHGLGKYATINDVPFNEAVDALKSRNAPLQKIELTVDEAARARDAAEVTQSPFFQDLKKQAAELRAKRVAEGTQSVAGETAKLANISPSPVSQEPAGLKKIQLSIDEQARARDAAQVIENPAFQDLKKKAAELRAQRAASEVARPVAPMVEGTTPTVTRQIMENMKGGLRTALEDFRNGTLNKWGEKTPLQTNLSDTAEKQLADWAAELDRRMGSARATVAATANETRNFILHDYNKTYGDKFASYMLMYHYWPSRTYMRTMERVVSTPGTLATYAKWRSAMTKEHADQPDYYRYNLQVPSLPGLNNSPMLFNLEAAFDPINNLTGVDFNDPTRRGDWMSSSLDDMGKMGFNTSIPIQWAMAFNLYRKGEDEAARRWMGRAIPATQTLKSGLNLLQDKTGVNLMPDISILPGAKYGEFDPFINAQGGLDPYEEKRVGRALATMVMDGKLTQAQAYDAMYTRNENFDAAVHAAIDERAGGQLASYFAGVGFKNRSQGDVQVEKFYNDYYKLLSVRSSMSPEDYRKAFDQLRSNPQYQFADTVLLSARGGDERDGVYAYNVLSRVPPGDSTALFEHMGLSQNMVDKFYNDKGDFSKWSDQDKKTFMSAMLNLGAVYDMPDGATRGEWNDAKSSYAKAQEEVSKELGFSYVRDNGKVVGRGVWDLVSTYYDMRDKKDPNADEFKKAHPQIDLAMTLMDEAKISDPLLAKYYANLSTVEAYFAGKNRAILAEKFGNDITQKQQEYFDRKDVNPADAKAFLRQHKELIYYWSEKTKLEQGMNQQIVSIASMLPRDTGAQIRQDFTPANDTQSLIAEYSGKQIPSWQEVSAKMSTPLAQRVIAYWTGGAQLTNANLRELDYLARSGGYYDANDLLRQAGYSYLTQQQGAQQQPQPSGPQDYNPFAGQGLSGPFQNP